jgi:hypothetical protein
MPSDTLHQLQSGQLAGARELKLSAGLTGLPPELLDLADTLEVLDLSGNQLSALPSWLSEFKRLRVLFASNNPFTVLPEVLGALPALSMVGFKANRIAHVPAAALAPTLRWLILTDNALSELPEAIGRCQPMQKLMLAGNRLRHLPDSLAACRAIELLRISANQFEALPDWLLTLPRLSWLACAGNPFNAAAESQALAQAQATAIPWSDLRVQGLLGEGASGHIHDAIWQRQGSATPVAFKRFKGSMTSDGLPHSELAASLAAGTHPHLIGALGLVSGHPDGGEGLLMPRIDPHCQTLAGPPSFASCTRDVYADGETFTPDQALAIASGIAQAAAHLHARGMLHGDLYAHNILWGAQGEVRLGDFGAASFLPADTRVAQALMRQEVRAMGCLIEELAQRVDGDAACLSELAGRCLQDEVGQRPLMAEVAAVLAALQADQARGASAV